MKTLGEIRKDYKENKEEWDKMLEEQTKAKYKKCRVKDKLGKGKHGFDYLKMAEMYHNGKW